jgi:hypothetical protein
VIITVLRATLVVVQVALAGVRVAVFGGGKRGVILAAVLGCDVHRTQRPRSPGQEDRGEEGEDGLRQAVHGPAW